MHNVSKHFYYIIAMRAAAYGAIEISEINSECRGPMLGGKKGCIGTGIRSFLVFV